MQAVAIDAAVGTHLVRSSGTCMAWARVVLSCPELLQSASHKSDLNSLSTLRAFSEVITASLLLTNQLGVLRS